MKAAIRPDFFFKNMPSIQEADNVAARLGATEDERALHAMSQIKGWQVLKNYLEQLYKELNDTNKTAMAAGASLEEIGRNTVVVTLTQEIIEKLINKVADATDACTQNGEQ